MSDETIVQLPTPRRPETGLMAWQATIGYIGAHYSLDALLTIQAYPLDEAVGWAASASWGASEEQVRDCPSLPNALRALWQQVSQNHLIFDSREAIAKRPANYADDEWLDKQTAQLLGRMLHVTRAAFEGDWRLILVYQPVEKPEFRFQARLLAASDTVQVSGRGASLRDACRDVYRRAAPHYIAHSGSQPGDIS